MTQVTYFAKFQGERGKQPSDILILCLQVKETYIGIMLFLIFLTLWFLSFCRLTGKTFPLIFAKITGYHTIPTISLLDLDKLNIL